MALTRGWARRISVMDSVVAELAVGIGYDAKKHPEVLIVSLTQQARSEFEMPRMLEVRFSPSEAQLLGDAVVGFLQQLEE